MQVARETVMEGVSVTAVAVVSVTALSAVSVTAVAVVSVTAAATAAATAAGHGGRPRRRMVKRLLGPLGICRKKITKPFKS